MPLARRLAAFLLVSLWLPALLHCRLEAAGLMFGEDCCTSTPCTAETAADQGCVEDACEVIEGAFTGSTPFVLKAPDLATCFSLLDGLAVTPPTELAPPVDCEISPTTDAPPELVRSWALQLPGPFSPRAP